MLTAKSRGMVPALITPFTAKNEVHFESLAHIVEHAIQLSAGGLYVCGTTGEGFLLSTEEREQITEAVIAAASGRADVIVNISHMDYRQAIRLAAHAAQVGAAAVSTLPPLFHSISDVELLSYFRSLLVDVALPLTIYNIPHLTHRPLQPKLIEELAADDRFIGVKHTSEDTVALMEFKRAADGRLIVWSGRDAYLLGSLAMGADGAIGSSFQLLGDVFAEIIRAYRSGENDRAFTLQQRVNQVHGRLQVHGPCQTIKRCFTLLGLEAGDCRLPYGRMDSQHDEFHRETLRQADQLRRDFLLPLFAPAWTQ